MFLGNSSFMRDLIDECGIDLTNFGFQTENLNKYGISCSKLVIKTDDESEKLGFEKGCYYIFNAPLLSNLMPEHEKILFDRIKEKLQCLLKLHKIKKRGKILFVGIGNPDIIADCFGVWTVNKINIQPFKKNNKILKIIPNTFANTGINAYEIIRLIVEAFDVSSVFLFDSLATENIERLGSSIQFNDVGLTPGSAMNNFGMAINQETLHVPCFSLGVPMMISGLNLNTKKDVVLTEKDAREKIDFLSSLISKIIDELIK